MIDTMEQSATANAILVIDIDQITTRAVLCDVVEGLGRLVDVGEAATTSGPPFYETSIGINQAIRRLEDRTGRRLMDGDTVLAPVRPDGDGVDRLFVTGTPVPANRVGLLSLGQGELTHVLRSAVRRTVSELHEANEYFSWSGMPVTPTSVEGWMRDARPTTIILVAGDSGPQDWRATMEVVASMAPDLGGRQGIIVGDDDRQQVAAEVLEDTLELSGIDPAAYSPGDIASAIESELRDQYAASVQQESAFRPFSSGTFVDRVQSVENVTAFLHRRMGRNLAAMINQSGTLLEIATGRGAMSIFRADLDVNSSARTLLQIPTTDISRWVPFQMTDDEVRHWLLNRSLRPQTVITGDNDRQIAAGAVREMVSLAGRKAGLESDPDIDLILVGRELMQNAGSGGLLVALDALRPLPSDGVVMLSVDRDSIAGAVGSISVGEPDYAREVIENDFLSPLASCVVFQGEAQAGSQIAEIEIATDTGDRERMTLNAGEVLRFPLGEGRTAEVTVSPSASVGVGRYAAGEQVTYDGDRVLHGGSYGIVFDGRSRQSTLPVENDARLTALRQWEQALAGSQGEAG